MQPNELSGMKVWIDQDLCTGDGLCEEIAPSVFSGHEDGLFYVKEDGSETPREPTHKMSEMVDVKPENVEAEDEAVKRRRRRKAKMQWSLRMLITRNLQQRRPGPQKRSLQRLPLKKSQRRLLLKISR